MLSSFGRTARALLSIALLVTMLASGLIAPAGAAAQAQSVQSQLAGVTITYGPPYVLDPGGSYADDVLETMLFTGTTDILSVGFITPLIDLNGARDLMLEAMFGDLGSTATIDRGDYAGVSYSLDMLNFEGQEMGVFSLFMNQRSHGYAEFYIYIAPPALFGTSMQAAQGAFAIDGTPLMDGVDAIAMGNLVTANIGITGGTAVTDVTDVASQPEETAVATEVTTQPDTTTSADSQAYLDTLNAQRVEYVDSLKTFDEGLKGFVDETATDEQKQVALQSMVDVANSWTTYNDRAAQVAAPAGMENLHAQYLQWSDNITTSGTLFLGAIQQQGPTLDDFFAQLAVAVDYDAVFGQALADAGSANTGTTTTTTTTETTGSNAEAEAYLGTLIQQRNEYVQSFISFTEALGVIADANSTDADKQAATQTTVDIAVIWSGYNQRAANVVPPAGMEDVHAMYLTWSDQISTMGNLFMGVVTQDGTTFEDVVAQMEIVQTTDTAFSDLLATTTASLGTGDTTTTAETPVATEASSGTTRTTRTTSGTDSTETPEATEARSGTARTTRTTSGTDATETPEATEESSGTTRSTRNPNETSGGNTSETQGRTGTPAENTGATTGEEWLTPINDVTITWGEGFELNPTVDEPQSSDEESSEDRLRLIWTNSSGNPVGISLTVLPNQYADSSNLITLLSDDPQNVQDIFGADAVAVDSVITDEASAILIYAVDEQGEFYSYVQMTCVNDDCSTLAMLVISNDATSVIEVVAASEEGIAVNGVPVAGVFSSSEVQDAIDAFGN